MLKPLLTISKLENVPCPRIPGFLVASTAPINVEGDDLPAHKTQVPHSRETSTQREEEYLHLIAELLYEKLLRNPSDGVDLIISTHGFSNSKTATQKRIEEIYAYIHHDYNSMVDNGTDNLMYIGYRWPSEPLMANGRWWLEKIRHTIAALPVLPRILLIFGTLSILISLFFNPSKWLGLSPLYFILSIVTIILTALFFFVVSLIVLRLSVYFRDNYRATHFGVPDLVELIRQLDKALVSKAKEDYIHNLRLIDKLETQFCQKLKHQLAIEGIIITDQEELTLATISKKIVKDYCKDRNVERIKVENLGIQDLEGINKFTNQGNIDVVAKIAYNLIKQETEPEFVRLRETAIEILENKAQNYWKDKNRIKLTFIGHSLGAEVVTSTIRIISDIFDLSSIGTLGLTDKLPSSNIGRVFCLERLVLMSPDIPISTILSGRANVLRSSLRRFKEAYLFSNEGDLALRLASTLANYFSFPARTREGGYRLGNVGIRDSQGYGICNLNSLSNKEHTRILKSLFVDSLDVHKSLATLQDDYQFAETANREEVANLFTYFDCTAYKDKSISSNSKQHRILSLEKWRWEPRWVYYLRLIIAYSLGIIDTHGGYFNGQFSQQLIYRLAFFGFGSVLDSFDRNNRKAALDYLARECCQKQIQVILSPERYAVDVLGRDRKQVRKEILNA